MNILKHLEAALFVKPPAWFRMLSVRTAWRIPTEEKLLFLTFDDGPVPGNTEWILSELKQREARATFFCTGDNVQSHPALYQRIMEEGHDTGNHTMGHLDGYRTGIRRYVRDVYQAGGFIDSKLFRPPYGRIRPFAGRILSSRFYVVLWDILSMDYDTELRPEKVLDHVLSAIRPGSIIVFHDNRKARKNLEYVLPRVLDACRQQGFKFVPLTPYLP